VTPQRHSKHILILLILSLVALSWISLWIWNESPAKGFLDHNASASLNQINLISGLLFILGWTLMVFAMMLPTTIPLILSFHNLINNQTNHKTLVSSLIVGYVGIWSILGLAVHITHLGIHTIASQYLISDRTTLILVAIVLALSGLYQFTNLKYRCLIKCRSPFSFILARWHSNSSIRQALLLGYKHGVYCIGCCWTLMMIMFLTGSTNLVLMMLIGGVMAIEKNSRWGLRIKKPLGYLLISSAAVLVVWPLVIRNQ